MEMLARDVGFLVGFYGPFFVLATIGLYGVFFFYQVPGVKGWHIPAITIALIAMTAMVAEQQVVILGSVLLFIAGVLGLAIKGILRLVQSWCNHS
ncbi:MAG: hypothetical protein R6V55_09565 [Desulfovermiculus sp.]